MLEDNPLLEREEDSEDLQPVPLEDDVDHPLDDDVPEDYDWEQDVIGRHGRFLVGSGFKDRCRGGAR